MDVISQKSSWHCLVQKKFEKMYDRWSVFWTMIPLSSYERDMSDDLNFVIEQYEGDAIVNLKVEVGTPAYNALVTYTFLNHLPIIPTLHRVKISGEVVRILNP
jgi:hypothetical protein